MTDEDYLVKKQAKITRGYKVLDVGFAQNPNYWLKEHELIGIDVQKVKKPENYSKVHAINLNENGIPYSNGYFNTVILGSCLEHVENPTKLLKETNRLLRVGGQAVITIPHANYWWTTVHNYFMPFYEDKDKGEHLSNWAKLDAVRLFKKNGFQVNKIYSTHMIIPFINYDLRVPNWLHMLGWCLIFDCEKISEPKDFILTRRESDKKFIEVK